MKSSVRFFHYTAGVYLPMIIKDRFIKLATAGVDTGEMPAVWLSTNEVWEHTASKMASVNGLPVQLTKQQQYERFGLARIEVLKLAGLISWEEFGIKSGVSKLNYDFMENLGRMKGAEPEEWWAYFQLIPSDTWLRIEIWNGTEWKSAY